MTNNKQQTAVKLYTEEQVIDIFQKYGNMSDINARNIIDLSESIEIPSDEEIDEKAFQVPYDNTKDFYDLQFIKGAKWMRDKIQGGEQ
jgi:LPS O-antigen subunit length determinant protein (WzzB/FepE family)